MITTKCAKTVARPNEKSTSKIVGAINEVLRVRMLHNRYIQSTKSIMPHPSSNFKLLRFRSVTDVLFLCLFYGEIAQIVNLILERS